MPSDAPEVPAQPNQTTPQEIAPEPIPVKTEPTAPGSGRRPSFRDLRRQLNEEELRQTGVSKLLVEDFEKAEQECEALRKYVDWYHEKDKEVARLNEKLKTSVAFEIITGTGLAAGGAIISLASLFWEPKDTTRGIAALGVGFLILIGSTIAKVVQVKK